MAFDEKFVRHIIDSYPKSEKFVAFDIGANVGFYTKLLAPKFQKVYAFEICSETCTNLKRNLNENSINNVEIVNAGICDVDRDDVVMYIQHDNPENKGGNTLSYNVAKHKRWGHNPDNTRIIKGMTLDTFVTKRKIKNLRFIKMDIEGGEDFAWKGAHKTLTENNLDILLEVHNYVNYVALHRFFKDRGYAIFNNQAKEVNLLEPDTHYFITNRHK